MRIVQYAEFFYRLARVYLRPRLVWWQIVIVLANSFTQANINTARIGSPSPSPTLKFDFALFDLILLFLIIFLLHYVPPTRLYLASRNFSFFAGDHTRPQQQRRQRGAAKPQTQPQPQPVPICVYVYAFMIYSSFIFLEPCRMTLYFFDSILAQCLCPYIILWPPWSPFVFRTPLEPQLFAIERFDFPGGLATSTRSTE